MLQLLGGRDKLLKVGLLSKAWREAVLRHYAWQVLPRVREGGVPGLLGLVRALDSLSGVEVRLPVDERVAALAVKLGGA